ncbi:gustatory receptor for sugar taste 43a-like [Teleopsis dalmanni]|nr:gustatory receptor for sugar taste 43a-like [Teleopsis dalmanni]
MKSATSKVVTALDVSVVVLATSAGSLCGLFGFKATRELNIRLRKVDETLHSSLHFKRDRIRAIAMIVLPLGTICSLLALDIGTWLRFASKSKSVSVNTETNIHWYIPFYSLYLLLTGLHVSLANTAFGLCRRYNRLNLFLKTTFLTDRKHENASKQKVTTVKSVLQSSFTSNTSLVKVSAENQFNNGEAKKKSTLIRLMAENHDSLGKCVYIVSSSYGAAVLFILVSCLLHLVATAYFLFLEMFNTKDGGYLWLQVLWIIFHALRLLLIVEPCHLASVESKKTIQIVCEMERKIHDPILAEEIKKFWQQLLIMSADFTASGLCRVNRNILTSFSSAIATYLVILIQFQKTNG